MPAQKVAIMVSKKLLYLLVVMSVMVENSTIRKVRRQQVDYTHPKVSALAPLASSTAKAAAALGTGGERLAPMWFR